MDAYGKETNCIDLNYIALAVLKTLKLFIRSYDLKYLLQIDRTFLIEVHIIGFVVHFTLGKNFLAFS